MANPAVTTRTTPAGAILTKGHKCKFAFGLLPGFVIREFEITPGEIDGGEPIPLTTFFNTVFHEQGPQTLIKTAPFMIKGFYDPDVYKDTQIKAIINRNQACTFLLPNLSTLNFYGFPNKFRFGTFKEGAEAPSIEVQVVVSNRDPVNLVEAGWYYVDGYTGTSDG